MSLRNIFDVYEVDERLIQSVLWVFRGLWFKFDESNKDEGGYAMGNAETESRMSEEKRNA